MKDKYANLTQVACPEEQETFINIDYYSRTVKVYTTKATVMRRMLRAGYEPSDVGYLVGNHESPTDMTWIFPSSDVGKFLRTGLFKFD